MGQGADRLYAVLDHVSRNDYKIYLAYTPDCNGASACRVGTFTGERVPAAGPTKGKTIRLSSGVSAIYTESECGANCSDSVIQWREGDTQYSAGEKAGSQDDVLRLANACLRR